jgi:hypothetical protein
VILGSLKGINSPSEGFEVASLDNESLDNENQDVPPLAWFRKKTAGPVISYNRQSGVIHFYS